jgi:hypothetical protein
VPVRVLGKEKRVVEVSTDRLLKKKFQRGARSLVSRIFSSIFSTANSIFSYDKSTNNIF